VLLSRKLLAALGLITPLGEMPMCKRTMLLVILASTIWLASAHAASGASKAFLKLQTLAGDWEGSDERGNAVKSNFKLVVSGTAILEMLRMSGTHEMLTVYSVDKNAIALLHYCPTNNQPQMRAIPPEGEINELVFQFQRVGNLPSLDIGHEHKLVIQFQDENHITERWTWRRNGQDTEMTYRLVRKPAKSE
jgi:hypothetical protein